jgi:hypothetical protein
MVFAALGFAVAGTWARAALTVGLVISALAMLVALLSLGALLAPTVVAAAIALVVTRLGAHTRAATEEPQPSQERGVARWPVRFRHDSQSRRTDGSWNACRVRSPSL